MKDKNWWHEIFLGMTVSSAYSCTHWDLSLCSSQKISKEIRNTWINSMTVHYIMNLQMWNQSRLQVSYEYSPRFDPFASCVQIVCLVEIAMSILAVKTAFAIIWFKILLQFKSTVLRLENEASFMYNLTLCSYCKTVGKKTSSDLALTSTLTYIPGLNPSYCVRVSSSMSWNSDWFSCG